VGNPPVGPVSPEDPLAGITPRYRVLAVNRRGMAFPDQDFSTFAIFPPANFIHAQVLQTSVTPDTLPRLLDNGEVEVRYSAVADSNGSTNSTSAGKTNFWQFADELYRFILPIGDTLATDEGIRGRFSVSQRMPGLFNQSRIFSLFDTASKVFVAPWVPVTPIDDAGFKNYFPLMRIDAVDRAQRKVLASSGTVLPMAEPMNCALCHATDAVAANAETSQRYGNLEWSQTPDIANQAKENVIKVHEALNGALLASRTPVMCAECHYSPVADPDGRGPLGLHQTRRLPLSIAIHAAHALNRDRELPTPDVPANIPDAGNTNCMICHGWGVDGKAFRGAMKQAGLVCEDCHGGMLAVGKSSLVGATETRTPFIDEPRCESCHTGDELGHLGSSLVLRQAYEPGDIFARPRLASNRRFAEEPGKLYRQSVGHGGVACMACHGSTHAIWPVATADTHDNEIPIQLQGHAGSISECETCHEGGVPLSLNGPHGLHNINSSDWILGHGPFFTQNPGSACQACHGIDLEGGYLSRATTDRLFALGGGGAVAYARGDQVGCSDCHVNPLATFP
jgi:hypothetical protein